MQYMQAKRNASIWKLGYHFPVVVMELSLSIARILADVSNISKSNILLQN